jgi:hypothetical protein
MKKSALSAAIAGGTVPPPAPPPKAGAAGLLGAGQREDDYPFPCLLCARDDGDVGGAAGDSSTPADAAAAALASEVAQLKLDRSFVPAGSLPTNVGGLVGCCL